MLIIDEAHNLPQVIEETSSFKLSTETFIRVLKELNDVERKLLTVEKCMSKEDKALRYELDALVSPD